MLVMLRCRSSQYRVVPYLVAAAAGADWSSTCNGRATVLDSCARVKKIAAPWAAALSLGRTAEVWPCNDFHVCSFLSISEDVEDLDAAQPFKLSDACRDATNPAFGPCCIRRNGEARLRPACGMLGKTCGSVDGCTIKISSWIGGIDIDSSYWASAKPHLQHQVLSRSRGLASCYGLQIVGQLDHANSIGSRILFGVLFVVKWASSSRASHDVPLTDMLVFKHTRAQHCFIEFGYQQMKLLN